MVRNLALTNLFYLSLILQPNLDLVWPDRSSQPWLPAIALVVGVLLCNELAGLIWACVLGIGVDCLSIHRLGIHSVVATMLASGLMLAKSDHRPRGILAYGFFTFAVTFLWLIMAAAMHGFLEVQSLDFAQFITSVFNRAVSTTLLVFGVMIIDRCFKSVTQLKHSDSVVLANRWTMLTGK